MYTDLTQSIQYCVAAGAVVLVYYVLPYLLDPYDYRRRFSGPELAAFTNWWMSDTVKTGRHSEIIRELHGKYGTFVRIGPNHISIADPAAHEAVYGHSSGLLKSEFYNAFVNRRPDMFNTQDRVDHTKRRKRITNIFSPQNVVAFEPRVSGHIRKLCEQLDLRCNEALRGISGFNWVAKDGRAVIDCCAQFGFLGFDIISDLALGSPFGMVQLQRDATPIGQPAILTKATGEEAKEVPVISSVASTGMLMMSAGVYPSWIQKFFKFLPWDIPGVFRMLQLFNAIMVLVDERLKRGSKRLEGSMDGIDFLDKLLEVRNEDDSALTHDEIFAEALLLMGAGGDTTSRQVLNSLGALCYYLAGHPEAQRKLQEELDKHVPIETEYEEVETTSTWPVVEHEEVKNLPYLNACIKETLRLHSAVATGLPRIVPSGKVFTFGGETFKAGSVVSVPSFTTNRLGVWGSDAAEFRPERWLEDDSASLNKYFVSFSVGPRSCVGRNLAMMNLLVIAGTVFRRYEFEALPTTKLYNHEGFVRAAVHCEVAIRRREQRVYHA